METVLCDPSLVEETLRHLKAAGESHKECVVLWLAKSGEHSKTVVQVVHPVQVARSDFFHIPPVGMRLLLNQLAEEDLMIAAQVHSHPAEAFHSHADDQWAIVRHENALSLVVPDFARFTYADNFLRLTKVYRLSSHNNWIELRMEGITQWLRVQ